MKYTHIAQLVFERPWAIMESTLDVIADIVEMRMAGEHFTEEEIRQRVGTEAGRAPTLAVASGEGSGGAVAVLPLYGVIFPKANLFSEMSGGTSLQRFTRDFRQAINDPGVSAILFDVDSPGGMAVGLDELATEIRAARGRKPIVAIANHTMCSAAYYLGSAADEIVAAPSSDVGCIGTMLKHVEVSRAEDAEGITVNLIHHGQYKVEVSQHRPLSDEARAHQQSLVDACGELFVAAVAKGRGVPVATVRRDFGEGRWFDPKEAMRRGMIDRVDSFDATLLRLLKSSRPAGRTSMLADGTGVSATAVGTGWAVSAVSEEAEPLDEPEGAEPAPMEEPDGEPSVETAASGRGRVEGERARWEFDA